MSFSKVDICNRALGYLGVKPIASLGENTQPALRLSYIYNSCRDEVLREFDWGFARTIESLNLISGETLLGWNYLYVYPALCMKINNVFSDSTSQEPKPENYKVCLSPTSKVKAIAADTTPMYINYTVSTDDSTLYDSDFVEFFAQKLAAETAFVLTGKQDLAERMNKMYTDNLSEAKRTSSTERQATITRSSSFEDAR